MFVNQIAKVIFKFSEEFQIYLIAIFCIVFAKALVSFSNLFIVCRSCIFSHFHLLQNDEANLNTSWHKASWDEKI